LYYILHYGDIIEFGGINQLTTGQPGSQKNGERNIKRRIFCSLISIEER